MEIINTIDDKKELTLKETIQVLHDMQRYRRGHGNYMPHTPYIFGLAIDNAIRELRKLANNDRESV